MKRIYGLFFILMAGILIGTIHLFTGCDNTTSEDTGTITDTPVGDTSTTTDTGTTESVIHKSGETISSAQKWSGIHILEGTIYIKSGVEISPCTKILINPGARISVTSLGSIKSLGTKECPVVFTSARDSKARGDWANIEIFGSSSSDNAFDWTILEYGGASAYGMLWIERNATVRIDNTTFDNSKSYGVYIEEGANISSFSGNKFTNLDLNPIYITANEVRYLSPIETSGNAQNSVLVNGGTVSSAALWKNLGVPYLLKNIIHFKASVELEAGNTLLMSDGSKIIVSDQGSIKSSGTKEKAITFTSAKPSKAKGDWIGIEIYGTSSPDNAFSWTILEYGGKGSYGLVWLDNGASVRIDNTVFSNSRSYGLYIEEGAEIKSFTGNKFNDLDLNPIYLKANNVGQLDKIETSNNTANTVLINGGKITTAATWKNMGIPYEIKEVVYFQAAVEVEEGTTILMQPSEKLIINGSGSLKLKGTANANITIKSSKPSPASGDWKEIDIYASSNNDNVWSYVNIMHGGSGSYGQVWVEKGASLTLNNCKFSEGRNCDLYVENGGNIVNNGSTYTICPQ